MCFGGGGGTPPRIGEQAAEHMQPPLTTEEEERQQREQEFNENLDAAYNQALDYGLDRIGQRNLDPAQFQDQLTSELDRIRSTVPSLDPNPDTFFDDNIADIILGRAQDTRRRELANQVDQFAGSGFADDMWTRTADDAIIDAIIGEQLTPASATLARAQQRGTLSDTEYQRALADLGNQQTAIRSDLQGLGDSILAAYRRDLSDIGRSARDSATGFELGTAFDPDSYRTRIDDAFTDQQGRLEGDIRSLVGTDPLFDVGMILTGPSTVQGIGEDSPMLTQFYRDQQRRRQGQRRGLGTEGVF